MIDLIELVVLQRVFQTILQTRYGLRELISILFHDASSVDPGLLLIRLKPDLLQSLRKAIFGSLSHMREDIPHEVHFAPLP